MTPARPDERSSAPERGRKPPATNAQLETIRHEEGLINARLTWMLTFQGFLFAAVSLSSSGTRAAIVDVVPIVGMGVALLSLLGVIAAYGTIDMVRRSSSGPTFGGTRWRKWFGRANSMGIPVIVTIAWAALWVRLS